MELFKIVNNVNKSTHIPTHFANANPKQNFFLQNNISTESINITSWYSTVLECFKVERKKILTDMLLSFHEKQR